MARPSQSCRSGMTLTELLVVVAILLMLTVATLPRLRPTEVQKCREAALTLQSLVSRVARRAEDNGFRSNGVRTAGLWLEPLDPTAARDPDERNDEPAAGVLQLFVCEPQDPYRGDVPESARVYVHHPDDDPNDALLLFSSNTARNVREFARKASRIRLGTDRQVYFLRVLSDIEQSAFAGKSHLLPQPYGPTQAQHQLQRGFFIRKQLVGDGEVYLPFGGGGPVVSNAGDVLLAYVGMGSPAAPRPAESAPQFNPGQPPGALYDNLTPCNASPPTPSTEAMGCGCIQQNIEDGEPQFDGPHPICEPQPHVMPSNFPASQIGSSFQIDRPIARSATPPLALPDGYGIDVFWSSYGEYLLASRQSMGLIPGKGRSAPISGLLNSKGSPVMDGFPGLLSNHPIMVMFEPTGGVASLVFHRRIDLGGYPSIVEDRFRQVADVYLLVGRLDRAGRPFINKHFSDLDDIEPGANWQYPDSRWIRISKSTGEVVIAEPILGQKMTSGGTWPITVLESQANARLGIPASRN
jgi:prepilin-type N-terminal cleavage/methylation domain-containing protein